MTIIVFIRYYSFRNFYDEFFLRHDGIWFWIWFVDDASSLGAYDFRHRCALEIYFKEIDIERRNVCLQR